MTQPTRGVTPRPWVTAAVWAVGMLGVVAAAFAVRERVGGVAEAGGLPALPAMAGAVVLHVVANGVLVEAWRRIVALAGPRMDRGVAAWVWSSSQLARYAVGGAQVASRGLIGQRYDLPGTVVALTALVEVVWQVAISGAILLITLPYWSGETDLDSVGWLAVLPVGGLVAALVAPQAVLRSAAAVLRRVPGIRNRVPSPDSAALQTVTRGSVAGFTALQLLNTVLRSVALLLLFAAVGGDVATYGARAIGADAVGQFAGRVVVFAPGGVGPREGATALLLAPVLGAASAVILVAAARLAEILAELAFLGIARFWHHRGSTAEGEGGRESEMVEEAPGERPGQ